MDDYLDFVDCITNINLDTIGDFVHYKNNLEKCSVLFYKIHPKNFNNILIRLMVQKMSNHICIVLLIAMKLV